MNFNWRSVEMERCYERRVKVAEDFKACRKAFIALGDETDSKC